MSLPRGQSGFVLMDVVVSLTVMVAVLGGTLVSFNGFEERTRANQVHNDAQDRARVGIDRLARELRNHASASPALPDGLEVAGPYELVALSTADGTPSTGNPRNSRRVRYCLDSSDQASARLVTQVQTWTAATPPARPSTASCPDTAWGASTVLAANVTNRAGGRDRPVFRYDSSTLSEIK